MKTKGRCALSAAALFFFCVQGLFGALYAEDGDFDKERSRIRFEHHVRSLYNYSGLYETDLDFPVFLYAMTGYYILIRENRIRRKGIVSIVDFRKPCDEKRFYVIDLKKRRLLFLTPVSHGIGSGILYATSFSNEPASKKSSLGFFVTGGTYYGKYGYSLVLEGVEKGFNDNARRRNIVLHGAQYSEAGLPELKDLIGQSLGCPAVPMKWHRRIINAIKGGTCLFQFYDDPAYLKTSKYLNRDGDVANVLNVSDRQKTPGLASPPTVRLAPFGRP